MFVFVKQIFVSVMMFFVYNLSNVNSFKCVLIVRRSSYNFRQINRW